MAFSATRPPSTIVARNAVICPAQKKEVAVTGNHALLFAALTVGVAVSPMVCPPPAQANSYSDRVAAMEQRKKLLQDAKEQATGEAAASMPTGYDYLESMKSALSMKIPNVPETSSTQAEESPAATLEEAPAPAMKAFSWTRPAPVEAPPPVATPPAPKLFSFTRSAAEPEAAPTSKRDVEVPEAPSAPKPFSFSQPAPPAVEAPPSTPFSFSRPAAPETQEAPPAPKAFTFSQLAPKAPAPEVKPQPKPVLEAKKVEQQQEPAQESKKRKGPLPMALAQFLLLGMYVGGIYGLLAKSEDIGKAADTVSQAIGGLLKQANAK